MDLHAQTGIKPVPTLQTERLMLRTFRHDDAPVVLNALNNWDVTQWLTRVPFPYDETDFAWFLAEMCNDPDDCIWAIDSADGMIGCVSLGDELGYWLHPARHGHGLMTEATRCVCDWHFAQSDAALVSGYHVGNGPSSAVLTKLGFVATHVDRAVRTSRGNTVDIQRVRLSKAKWRGNDG